jgi:hypothetical protein
VRSRLLALIVVAVAATASLVAVELLTDAGPAPAAGDTAVLVGAGDIARCSAEGDEATAQLVEGIEGTVFTAGDNAYPNGTEEQFDECYDPTWGRFKARTRPALGNHDYRTANGAPYFDYFGSAAGEPGRGYYSYDLGTWHIVVLDSNCDHVEGGCDAGSPQERWLRADLDANAAECILAYWHHPRFSSARHGNDIDVAPFWDVLYEAGGEVVVTAHDHTYERFAPQDPEAVADPARGIRQFVVGTGGGPLYQFESIAANSEVRYNESYGVLKLTLGPGSYEWEFLPVGENEFTDTGSGSCH